MASIRIFERLTKKANPYNEAEILHLRSLTALSVVRELRIRPWLVPWLLVRGRAMMRREIETIVVFDGIEAVLKQLQTAGIPMYIISSNSPGNIRKLLEKRGLAHYFTRVYGNVGIFGKAKTLRQVIDRNKLDVQTTYYVGDEGRDIEAAKRVGVTSVAVSWGFNSAGLLAKHHPAVLVHTPAELGERFGEMLH